MGFGVFGVFEVWGFGFGVSSFRISGWFSLAGFEFAVPGSGFRIWGTGFLGFGVGFQGFGFPVGFRI